MHKDWNKALKNIANGVSYTTLNKEGITQIDNTVDSWIQEEKDLAIMLSTRLGAFVSVKSKKENRTLKSHREFIKKELLKTGQFESELEIPNIVSDLNIIADSRKKSVNMYVTVQDEKSTDSSQKIRYIRDQLTRCWKQQDKNEKSFSSLIKNNNLFLYISIKNTSKTEVFPLTDFIKHEEINKDYFNNLIKQNKNIKIKNISIAMQKQFDKDFYSNSKFVKYYEEMTVTFYKDVITHLKNQAAATPQLKNLEDENKEIEIN